VQTRPGQGLLDHGASYSQTQTFLLPPQLQELMNSLSGKGPSGPSSLPTGQSSQLPNGAPSSDQLLGFLLSP